jgi:hypothetical protein
MRTSLRFLCVAMMLCIELSGCKSSAPRNISGTWTVTNQSREQFLPVAQRNAAAKIVLDANGSFVASEIPDDLLYGPHHGASQLVTGNGDWKLVDRDGREEIQLSFSAIQSGQQGAVPYGAMLDVSSGSARAVLFYFQDGDADQGRKIEFEKK